MVQAAAGGQVFVLNQGDNMGQGSVSVLDSSTLAVVKTLNPSDGLGINPVYATSSVDGTYIFVVTQGDGVNPGDRVMVDIFTPNEFVHIIGTSKGRGFAGFVKRHHFRGGRASHGSMFHRAPGSIGSSAYPSRVLKGMRAAGHMGVDQVTIRNLRVVQVHSDDNTLVVRGAVPGPGGTHPGSSPRFGRWRPSPRRGSRRPPYPWR